MTGYGALVSDAAVVPRSGSGVVSVDGPDAISFLQSLVSQDLDPVHDGEGARSLLLQPQGKLTATFRLLRIGSESVLLDTDEDFGAALAEGLNRFRIRVKADVSDRSDAWGVLSVRGPNAVARVHDAMHVDVPGAPHAHVEVDGVRVVRADWSTLPGVDVIGPHDALARAYDALIAAGVAPATMDAYERARIEAGIPRQGYDVDDRTIPQEAFLERDAVSFTKGCFLGQELVCRIDTRGHVNRSLRRIEIPGANPERGAAVLSGGKEVGTITSVEPTDDGAIALAMLRRDVEAPGEVLVHTASGDVVASVSAV